ncbi:MAG: hypothetical protein M1834_006650 [Cirrosporium novae-zelandiae]|nr:MAG: hypothetical protein M1834_006650 [Cirrosporium novae-zelandiae]
MAPRVENRDTRPTVSDLQGDNHWTELAKKYWLKNTTVKKASQDVLKIQIWDALEAEQFAAKSLLILETLQILEKYLWPTYNGDSSNFHVLLIALIVDIKRREQLPTWDHFKGKPQEFSSLFRRLLSMSLDESLATSVRLHVLSFINGAFESLDSGMIRKECAPLVSISIWHNLHDNKARETKLEQASPLRKAWRAASKRFDGADKTNQAKLRFDRSWLYSMVLGFLGRLYDPQGKRSDNVMYCERFIEFLVTLVSQFQTRRYVNTMLLDLNILSVIKLSPLFDDDENGLFRDFFSLLRHFVTFPMNDFTGGQLSPADNYNIHCQNLARLQRTAIKHFKEKLTILALSNYASIDVREELQNHLNALDDVELSQLCNLLGFRTEYPQTTPVVTDRKFLCEILIMAFEGRKPFQEVASSTSVLPTEEALYEPALLRNESFDGSRPLAIPKLNLQYLTVGDFLWRSFILYRSESFFEIRRDMEDALKRIQPKSSRNASNVQFDGFSKMALPISKPAILEIVPPRVGFDEPSLVRAEISLDITHLGPNVRQEWDSLRPDDAVFLLAVRSSDDPLFVANGLTARSEAGKHGIVTLRAAEVLQVLNNDGKPLRETHIGQANGHGPRPSIRRLQLKLDAAMYKIDTELAGQGKPDPYEAINLIVRRRGRENNFKSVLESIRSLIISDFPMPSWLQEVFLGYGDPSSANYKRLPSKLTTVNFRDTFQDWQHLVESLPGKTVVPFDATRSSFGPPYVLQNFIDAAPVTELNPSKKRRRDQVDTPPHNQDSIKVSTYKTENTGPYPTDAPKLNHIRFTPAQVEAITSGTEPGLTVIVGPPGTGKTDVATQIINNLYHNFPNERTLIITHSNQALNQLFQKIISLDIDERHLLRLGHGEGDLETETNYSKYGRVESFLDNRALYLTEVDRLAASIRAPGAHGGSCETAGYFNQVYIKPAWTNFWEKARSPESSIPDIIQAFPFHAYFSNAPQSLFSLDAPTESLLDIAAGCEKHMQKIFSELEDIRPFEILRTPKDKANYLLTKEARIIAMTSTHAAIRRQEISKLGFHYDSVIMEEAAQVTEIESFVPWALQNSKNGDLPLKRVVLCGDHLQNSPIIENLAFRQYANMEQSLFLRLVRLGVPIVNLDQQGRARASIAELYKWRYHKLGNLPIVKTAPEFLRANAGFRYDYQFINVPDYKGAGEREPSPHFIQNLGEAEYAVALFQYMRLLGYPSSKITILTPYAGQKALIKDVLNHRCAKNYLFGLPRLITTVDKYQGEQNDYVILSLTRTKRVGYLRDVRRLTVALSRARLGVYILGRRDVFESCYELKPAFDVLFQRSDKLMLVTSEMYPTTRLVDADVESTPMESVEHLGQYVYEMTQAKVAALSTDGGTMDVETTNDVVVEEDDEEEMTREATMQELE